MEFQNRHKITPFPADILSLEMENNKGWHLARCGQFKKHNDAISRKACPERASVSAEESQKNTVQAAVHSFVLRRDYI